MIGKYCVYSYYFYAHDIMSSIQILMIVYFTCARARVDVLFFVYTIDNGKLAKL